MKLKNYYKLVLITLICGIISCSDTVTNSDSDIYIPPPLTNTTWEQIDDPSTVGWSLEKLNQAYEYSKNIQTESVMIIYQGKVLYYWGDITKKIWTHSCRKSFMSALYGIYVDAGVIDLNKTMEDLGIDDINPALSGQEKQAKVKMLLQARSGIYHEAAAESQSMKDARPERGSHLPGTFWYYNNWDFNTLGTIFNQETGKDFFVDLKTKILDPIGCEDYEPNDGFYQYESISIHPAYPFRITARDMARFGLLFLRKGEWNGQRIISESWINESTTYYSDLGTRGGYGYMWWVAANGNDNIPIANLPDGSFSAEGAYGQYCIVIPDYDLVVVHRVNSDLQHNVSDLEFGILLSYILEARTQ
jgi:CubicO group peptidase (beta-lactamase class C family)